MIRRSCRHGAQSLVARRRRPDRAGRLQQSYEILLGSDNDTIVAFTYGRAPESLTCVDVVVAKIWSESVSQLPAIRSVRYSRR